MVVNSISAWLFDAEFPTITFNPCTSGPCAAPDQLCTSDPCQGSSVSFTVTVEENKILDSGISTIRLTRSVTNPAGTMNCFSGGNLITNPGDVITFSSPQPTSYVFNCIVNPALPNQQIGLTVEVDDYAGNRIRKNRTTTMQGLSNWYQIQNASFHRRSTTPFINSIPSAAVPSEFAIGQEGVVTATATTINMSPGSVSSSDWQLDRYSAPVVMDQISFLNYVRARKDLRTFPFGIPSDLLPNTTYYVIAPADVSGLVIDSDAKELKLAKSKTVIIVNGNVTFTSSTAGRVFNSAGNSFAILATGTIRVHSNYSVINAILIADDIDFAHDLGITSLPVDRQLVVNGNLISNSETENTTIQKRDVTPPNTPSIQVNFNPRMYMELLPDLSTTLYEWRQVSK